MKYLTITNGVVNIEWLTTKQIVASNNEVLGVRGYDAMDENIVASYIERLAPLDNFLWLDAQMWIHESANGVNRNLMPFISFYNQIDDINQIFTPNSDVYDRDVYFIKFIASNYMRMADTLHFAECPLENIIHMLRSYKIKTLV